MRHATPTRMRAGALSLGLFSLLAACGTGRDRDSGATEDVVETDVPEFDLGIVPTDVVRSEASMTGDGGDGGAPTMDGSRGDGGATGDATMPPPDAFLPDTGILPIDDVPVPMGTLPAPGVCRLAGETVVLASDSTARARPVFGFANGRGFTFGTATSRMGAQDVWVARLDMDGVVTTVVPSTRVMSGDVRGGVVLDSRRESNVLLYSVGPQLTAAVAYYSGTPVPDTQRTVSATAAAGDAVDLVPFGADGLDGMYAIWRESSGGRGVLKLAAFAVSTNITMMGSVRDLGGTDNVGEFKTFSYTSGGGYSGVGIAYLTAGASSEAVVQWLAGEGAPGPVARVGAASGSRGISAVGTAAGVTLVYGEASGTSLHAALVATGATTTMRDVSLGAMTAMGSNPSVTLDGANTAVAFRAPLTGGSGRGIAVARLDAMLAVRDVSFLATAGDAGAITLARHTSGRFAVGWADVVGSTTTIRASTFRCE